MNEIVFTKNHIFFRFGAVREIGFVEVLKSDLRTQVRIRIFGCNWLVEHMPATGQAPQELSWHSLLIEVRYPMFSRVSSIASTMRGVVFNRSARVMGEVVVPLLISASNCSSIIYPIRLASWKTIIAATTEITNIKPIFKKVHFHEPVSWRMTATVAAQGIKRMETVRKASAAAGV